jgi:hypothetical protein
MLRRASTIVVGVLLTAASCAFLPDHQLEDAGAGIETFIAQNGDFAGYRDWPSILLSDAPDPAAHNAAPRRVFVNALPTDDDSAWPIGTIFVKEGSGLPSEAGLPTQTHAMVKRGGRYNVDGAQGWEWFELEQAGAPLIAWRGEQPPTGESYGCLLNDCASGGTVGCNDCHLGGRDNDFVLSDALQLGNIDASLLAP